MNHRGGFFIPNDSRNLLIGPTAGLKMYVKDIVAATVGTIAGIKKIVR